MYVKTENDTERPGILLKRIEDLPGGVVLNTGNLNLDRTKEVKEGAIVFQEEGYGLLLFKTAQCRAGGASDALLVVKNHEFIVGEIVSDGNVAAEITSIVTTNEDYDVLQLAGDLVNYESGVLYLVSQTGNNTNSPAEVILTGDATDDLTIIIPVSGNSWNANGVIVRLVQAADDNLAVSYQARVLTIALAKTTASKNNGAAIQTAVQALGEVEDFDFSDAVVTAGTGWDGGQTGAVIGTPVAQFAGGANYSQYPCGLNLVGILLNTVDTSAEGMNGSSAVLTKGTVLESLLPYPVNDYIKSLLPNITFA